MMVLARKIFWMMCAVLACGAAQAQIRVDEARIGCLDIQTTPNLTALVAAACNGKMSCFYKAPTPDQYTRAGVRAATRTFCTQAMEIRYQCGSGPIKTITVPGDAWTHGPAELLCEAPTPAGTPQPDTITIARARIGCLDLQTAPNLTEIVGRACNGRKTCAFKAPSPDEYTREGVRAATRTFCTQAMEIVFQCGHNDFQTITVPGDAWNQPPAQMFCEGAGGPQPLPPDASGRLRGWVDLHTHPLANLGFGGKLLYGGADVGSLLPADPDCHHNVRATSEQQALGHDKSTHGGHDFISNPCGDELRKLVIHGLQSGLNGADESEDALGYPSFAEWPVWNDLTHQKMWVEWIRRAYDGGLRVMVALAVNNKTLGDMTAGPGDYATDDKTSADLQIGEIKGFVGRHRDFMEVAYSSADVRRIVSANKVAVVVGIEVDHIGNFQTTQNPAVPAEGVAIAEIRRLYQEGVRYIFPIHVLDNAFGGTAAYVNLFNVSNVRESGHPYHLVCAAPGDNITYRYDNNSLDAKLVLTQLAKSGFAVTSITPPNCAAGVGEKNSQPLTPLGVAAIKEMMRLGMLIDIDHMSQAAADQALQLAQEFHYPVNSGHNGVRGAAGAETQNERSFRVDQYATIGRLHGMAGVGSGGLNAVQWLALYNRVMQAMGGGSVVGGFGTDTDGFAPGMKARGSSLQYTAAFPASRDGTKTWNYNHDGVAHYGMLWDFLQDVRTLPGGAAMVDGNFMYGADYFFHTWQAAEGAAAGVR
ncbi:MAG TPA: membrane dipeptidase [Candidatus Angelobacter sp.]|nr:membrane dipeptidase [Candidatus Angelobacter sp.]